jgi:hypothetical protein
MSASLSRPSRSSTSATTAPTRSPTSPCVTTCGGDDPQGGRLRRRLLPLRRSATATRRACPARSRRPDEREGFEGQAAARAPHAEVRRRHHRRRGRARLQGQQGRSTTWSRWRPTACSRRSATRYAFDFYRDTYGMRGRVSAITGNVLTLSAARGRPQLQGGDDDHRRRHRDRRVSARGTTFVTAVDEDGGKVTVDDVTDITGTIQVNDYLFRDGRSGHVHGGPQGLHAALGAGATARTRSAASIAASNPNRLAGSRLDDTSLNAEVALGRLAVKISKVGKSTTSTRRS